MNLDLTLIFDRWKRRWRADDAALAAHLQVDTGALADLSRQPIPASNDDVERLCAAYGLTFDCLADLLWETALYSRRDRHQSIA